MGIDILNVDRIDHGVRSVDDDKLVERIAKMRMPLTLCPLSNLKLCVVDKMEDFPLRKLMDANVCCTINSDDPAYFGGYINDNFRSVANACNLSAEDLQELAKNSFEACFAPETQKKMDEDGRYVLQRVQGSQAIK